VILPTSTRLQDHSLSCCHTSPLAGHSRPMTKNGTAQLLRETCESRNCQRMRFGFRLRDTG
jgi:hypothetical protein